MKIFILSLILVLVFSAYGFCHNPSNIEATINKTKMDIVVYHAVSDPMEHYIKKIVVNLNGQKIAEKDFVFQTDEETQKTGLDIENLKKGDVLKITAFCSRYGDLTKQITGQ